ncbi:MAG: 50S ribosomal protein L5 [Patescibacteria group bacterium]|nr:50S ribosomal protein L5 [Patescibacteria group bacterium]
MPRLKDKYQKEVLPKLKEEFGIKNILSAPKIEKVVINVGMGDAKENQAEFEKVLGNLTALGGQKPVVTRAKKSISGFKLVQGQPVGLAVTLRGDRMYEFLDKLVTIVFPKVRDFRGIAPSFDSQGNLTIGLKEQAIFPEVSFQAGGKVRGLEISVVTSAKTKEEGRRLLELLGMPFKH